MAASGWGRALLRPLSTSIQSATRTAPAGSAARRFAGLRDLDWMPLAGRAHPEVGDVFAHGSKAIPACGVVISSKRSFVWKT